MLPIKINADYEFQLFNGKQGKQAINYSLEFLAFYIEEGPFFSTKNYAKDFLDHVEEIRQKKLKLISKGASRNWWGSLSDFELEKKLNSKLTPFLFGKDQGLFNESILLNEEKDLFQIQMNRPMVLKSLYGMSGSGIHHLQTSCLLPFSFRGPYILEPLRKRIWDFSCFVTKNNELLFYQNLVDDNFQYRGTIFRNYLKPNVENLSFYSEVSKTEWENYLHELSKLICHYRSLGALEDFSVDSYVYEENGTLKLFPYCEVNYRKTMGYITHQLSKMYATDHQWTSLILYKKSAISFLDLKKKIHEVKNVILLSPSDVRFVMVFLFAKSSKEGELIKEHLKLFAGN